jgi:hypothetical protein
MDFTEQECDYLLDALKGYIRTCKDSHCGDEFDVDTKPYSALVRKIAAHVLDKYYESN